jgi:hypothetical protein
MQHRNTVLQQASILTFLGLNLLALAMPWSAHAGTVHVSLGFKLPVPVAVVPAPLPVVVAPAPVGGAAAARGRLPCTGSHTAATRSDRGATCAVPWLSTARTGEKILWLEVCTLETPSL